MSYIEDNKEVQWPWPRDPKKKWNKQGKRDARRNKRKNKPKKPIRDFFYRLGQTGILGEKQKACSSCGNARRAERHWKKDNRKRDRNWR